jgi:hypothetical protein
MQQGEARVAKQAIAVRSSPQIRRVPHLINADKVFGTHRRRHALYFISEEVSARELHA